MKYSLISVTLLIVGKQIYSKLKLDFFRQKDVVSLAKNLLGKVLCTKLNGEITKGIITEVEAYNGVNDKACHAYNGKRTARTEVMFHKGGKAYVYLCYGIHHLFNVVTGKDDDPTAILIRSIYPLSGNDTMLKRRGRGSLEKIANGPGNVTQALGITTELNGESLLSDTIWIEDHGFDVPEHEISRTPRIGVEYAKEDALLLYRFVWQKNDGFF